MFIQITGYDAIAFGTDVYLEKPQSVQRTSGSPLVAHPPLPLHLREAENLRIAKHNQPKVDAPQALTGIPLPRLLNVALVVIISHPKEPP